MFKDYVATKGMIRPDLMPRCREKLEWFRTFNEISAKFSAVAVRITGAIYLSEGFFVSKQCSAIQAIRGLHDQVQCPF